MICNHRLSGLGGPVVDSVLALANPQLSIIGFDQLGFNPQSALVTAVLACTNAGLQETATPAILGVSEIFKVLLE